MSDKYPFLDLLGKKLDNAQSLALETVENAVIAAGAGSGKTQVLATRFAWLVLTDQAKADEILTLTFTNKAAAEMYQRIYSTLNFFASCEVSESFTEKQKQLAQNGLSDFANAHIQTLDSYCAAIVRQCSNRYGIQPDFSTGSADGQRDIKNRALKYTLSHATRPGIQAFSEPGKLQNFANKKLVTAIGYTDITTPEGYFSSKLPVQTSFACKALNFYLSDKEQENEEFPGGMNLLKIFNEIESIFEADAEPKKHIEYKIAVEAALKNIPDKLTGFILTEKDFAEDSPKFKQMKTDLDECIQLVSPVVSFKKGKIKEAGAIVKMLRDEILPTVDCILTFAAQYKALEDLYKSFDEFLSEVNSAKQLSGNLTFGDVSSLALKILTENQDIREQEIHAYKKIMIDEFQDNNGDNRNMLYLLSLRPGTVIDPQKDIYPQIIVKDADGKIIEDKRSSEKLFFVGDEKQSIYKFRGADVSVFNQLTSNNENKLISMTYNYRSTPEVISAFNILFKNGNSIFDAKTNQKDYEAYYNDDALKNGVKLPELTKESVPFHIRFVNTDEITKENQKINVPSNKFIPAEDQIGYYIATTIYNLGKEKQNWSDFAILDKSRTHRSSVTRYLNLFKVPYVVDQVSNIFEEGIINDFYNFLRICVYPSDINAYSAYLCSPLCGLTENSLEIILSYLNDINKKDFVFNPFADFNEKIREDLSEDQFLKFEKAQNFYKENKSLVLQQKITSTLNLLWHQTGYKYETMLNAQVDLYAEHFDLLFELARTCDDENKSVSWFIDELENLKSTWTADDADLNAADVSYPLERSKAVQIMSIHKSKGLQFDHVFICGCTGVKPHSEQTELFFEENTGVSIKPDKGTKNFICKFQKDLADKKDLAEFRRLIYVGITRAIKDVYITGSWNPASKKAEEEKSEFHLFERLVEKNCTDTQTKEVIFTPETAFDFANLSPVTYEQARFNNSDLSTDKLRNQKITEIADFYKNAQEIHYESNAILRSCPSALEPDYMPDSEDALQDSAVQKNAEEPELSSSKFTAADFGVLVHEYLEMQANGIAPEVHEPDSSLFKDLSPEKITEQKQKCIEFARLFDRSPLGLALKDAKAKGRFFRAEWAFKMYWKDTLWTGSIDLIFKNEDGTFTIVDYKSDENAVPEKYYGQQNCYRTAAAKMLSVSPEQIDCKLWFMKSNSIFQVPDDRQ